MRAVGGRVGVLAVVRAVVHLLGEQGAVVALLQLDRVGAGRLGGLEQLLALFDAALVVVADLRDDIAVAVVRDFKAVDDQFSHDKSVKGKDY